MSREKDSQVSQSWMGLYEFRLQNSNAEKDAELFSAFNSLSAGSFFGGMFPVLARGGRGLRPEALVPIRRSPPQIAYVIFYEGCQFFNPDTEHLLKALGEVLLSRAVHTDAFDTVSMPVAAHLGAGAVIHLCRQAFGNRRFWGLAFHALLRKQISLR